MKWLLIGTLLGSTVTSQHDNREACEGRAVLLREKNANVQCVEQKGYGLTGNVWTINPNNIIMVQP